MAGYSLSRQPINAIRCAPAYLSLDGARRGELLGWAIALAGALDLGFLAAAPSSLAQPLGGTECSDTIDNDADGFIDLADPSCLGNALNDTETLGTQCDDNLDNEPDGQTDLADAGCLADLLRNDETGEFIVNSTLDKIDANPGDGLCETPLMGECTVRAAIMEANAAPGEQGVQLPAGTFELTIAPVGLSPATADGDLDITDDLVLIGAGAEHTRIGGASRLAPFSDRVFEILPATQVTISAVTTRYGDAGCCVFFGGGISNAGTLTLTNSTVSGNASSGGGGIYDVGTLTITNSTVSGNLSEFGGGGIYINGGGTLTLTDSTVSGNVAYYLLAGGGILNQGTATLINTTVSGNDVTNGGGGGIRNYPSGIMTLTNSTVSGNDGDFAPGGIRNAGILTLTNSTVSGNHNRYDGGSADGIQSDSLGQIGQTQATNSIIAANGTTKYGIENCSGPFVSNGHNLSDDTTCFPAAGADLVVADAMLAPLADNGGPTDTHDLLPGSPAIDAGSPGCPPPDADQRGVARPQGADCDIGAVEFVPEPEGWLMLVAGAAFLGLLYRRRARRLRFG
jgi:hypothetical protein